MDARKLNWAAIQDRKNKIVTKHAKGLEFLMKKNKVETVKGYGKLTGPAQNGVFTVEVTTDGKSQPPQGQKRNPGHRLGSSHASRPRRQRPHPD